VLVEMRRGLLGDRRQRGLAGWIIDVPPTEPPWRERQTLAFLHVFDPPGPRTEDVQLLVVPCLGRLRAGLMFLLLSHARL
jgi:hypothetical protein